MTKKNNNKLIKHGIRQPESKFGEKAVPLYGLDHPEAKVAEPRATTKKKLTKARRNNRRDGKSRFDLKEAENQASSCQSVHIKKSDITTIITVGSQILGKFQAALDQRLMQLKVPAYIRCSLNRVKGTKASVDAHVKPTINPTKIVTAHRFGQDLTDDDIIKLTKIDKEEFKCFQDAEEIEWNRNQDQIAFDHKADQLKAEVEHYQDQAIAETAFNADEYNRGVAYTVVPFSKVSCLRTPYAKALYTKSADIASLVAGSNYEYKIEDGAYIKVNVPRIERLQMTVAEAQIKVEAGLVRCPDLDNIKHDLGQLSAGQPKTMISMLMRE